jgi:hypothetical protein
MNRDYRFENVICKGKRLGFIVHDVKNFAEAKKKAVNFCLKKLNLDKSEFKSTLNYLNQNIENGGTRVTPLKKEEQLNLDMESKSSKFDQTYELLYKGIINEWQS